LFFCSFASRHFLIQTEGGNYSSQVPAGEDYREVQLPDYKVQEGCNICGLERDDGVTRLDYTDYIVGAQSHDVDKANKYPWMISLRKTRNKGKSFYQACGASLIASKYVLTAAHCVYKKDSKKLTSPNEMKVVLGEHDYKRQDETFLETKEFRLKNIIVHEGYGKNKDEGHLHDIALLELEEEVDLSVYTPVCLPSYPPKNRDNTPALTIGWGKTAGWIKTRKNKKRCNINSTGEWTYHQRQGAKNILQQVKLMVEPQDRKGFLRIEHGNNNNGICNGDSGGPLLSRDGVQHTIIGVTSHTISNITRNCKIICWPGSRSYFTQVEYYSQWIDQNMVSATFCNGGPSARN